MVIVRSDLALLWCNTAAKTEISGGRSLRLLEGRLTLGRTGSDAALTQLLEKSGEVLQKSIVEGVQGEHVLISARAIPHGNCAAYGIEFARADMEGVISVALIKEVFGLRNSEERVLQCLMNGCNAKAAAEQLQLGMETIRSHIRSIYVKLSVNSRESLFRKVVSYIKIESKCVGEEVVDSLEIG